MTGEHPVVTRLLKAMFFTRPPQPKYMITWDVNVVLQFLELWDPPNELKLKQLTLKTVALVALVSAQRSQTLAALSVGSMTDTQNEIFVEVFIFVIKDILKTSRPGKTTLTLHLPAFPENRKLCVSSLLTEYIARTSTIRQSLNSQKIFISFGKPYKVVCVSSIARRTRMVLDMSRINTDTFEAHSFRSASTSKAESSSVSLDVILRTADWQRLKTFRKFYKKPIHDNLLYAKSVLSS